jgi:hypothetical protein
MSVSVSDTLLRTSSSHTRLRILPVVAGTAPAAAAPARGLPCRRPPAVLLPSGAVLACSPYLPLPASRELGLLALAGLRGRLCGRGSCRQAAGRE